MPEIKIIKTCELIPYAKNSRTHSQEQVAAIAGSIQEFGFTNPILVGPDSMVIAGHGRLLAASMLRLAEVPCIVLDHLTKTQARALVIADNKLALNAGWDDEMLALELEDLAALDVDMDLLGFSEGELGELMVSETEGLTDKDEIQDLHDDIDPKTRPGDIWILGKHRIICGSSTCKEDVDAVLNGVQPHLMVTDPPYGVNYDPAWREKTLGEAGRAVGKVENDHCADWTAAWELFLGDVAYIWHSGLHCAEVSVSLGDFCRARTG